jgi:hypothetical protein
MDPFRKAHPFNRIMSLIVLVCLGAVGLYGVVTESDVGPIIVLVVLVGFVIAAIIRRIAGIEREE